MLKAIAHSTVSRMENKEDTQGSGVMTVSGKQFANDI